MAIGPVLCILHFLTCFIVVDIYIYELLDDQGDVIYSTVKKKKESPSRSSRT